MRPVLLVLVMMLSARGVTAQNDSATARCAAIAQARPDSMVKVDTEATPDRLPAMNEGPNDADQRAVVAHFVVSSDGRVDTTTITVEHTRDAAWIERLRRNLASAIYKPARTGGCPVARWSTFAVWSGQP